MKLRHEDLIKEIESDETGVLKGYRLEFLEDKVLWISGGDSILKKIMQKDLNLFKDIEKSLLGANTPKHGDYVEFEEGKYARISCIHPGGQIQLSNKIGVFCSVDSTQASGSTWDRNFSHIDSEKLNTKNLTLSGKSKKGSCWTFSGNEPGPHRGVWFEINFHVWGFKNH